MPPLLHTFGTWPVLLLGERGGRPSDSLWSRRRKRPQRHDTLMTGLAKAFFCHQAHQVKLELAKKFQAEARPIPAITPGNQGTRRVPTRNPTTPTLKRRPIPENSVKVMKRRNMWSQPGDACGVSQKVYLSFQIKLFTTATPAAPDLRAALIGSYYEGNQRSTSC